MTKEKRQARIMQLEQKREHAQLWTLKGRISYSMALHYIKQLNQAIIGHKRKLRNA